MYFPFGVWQKIRSYMFHDISLGLHLRKHPFNEVVSSIPLVTPGFDYIAWRSYDMRSGMWRAAHFTSSLLGYCVEIAI